MADNEKPLEEQTKDELAATMAAEAGKQQEKPVETASEIEIKIGNATYRGATHEEVLKIVAKAKEDADAAIRDRERQIFDLRQKEKTALKPPTEDTSGMNPDQRTQFYKLLEEDPAKALQFADKIRFGVDDPGSVLQEAKVLLEDVKKTRTINEEVLKFCADVPDYAKVATTEVDTAMRERLEEKARGFTAENMKLTYLELVQEGKIGKPVEKAPETKPKAPPPSASGGGSSRPATEPDYDNMTKDELRKHLKEAGIEVYAR